MVTQPRCDSELADSQMTHGSGDFPDAFRVYTQPWVEAQYCCPDLQPYLRADTESLRNSPGKRGGHAGPVLQLLRHLWSIQGSSELLSPDDFGSSDAIENGTVCWKTLHHAKGRNDDYSISDNNQV